MRIEAVVSAREGNPDEAGLARAVEILRMGGFLVHPTATVYGIGAAPTPELDGAVNRLKGRPIHQPILRLAPDVARLRALRPELVWGDPAERLARRFWPGGLTLVLDDGTENGLGVRVDGHSFPRAVTRRWDDLLSSTSLNRAGEEPVRDATAAREILAEWPDPATPCVLADGGTLKPSPPSTVLTLREDPPRILRDGAVDRKAIEDCLGREVGA